MWVELELMAEIQEKWAHEHEHEQEQEQEQEGLLLVVLRMMTTSRLEAVQVVDEK